MALFENYDRRIKQIEATLNKHGIKNLEEAKKIITDQDHSGYSWRVVVNMVKTFCERGEEFVNYVKD